MSYTTFDLADVSQHEPLLIRSLFEELKRLVESGAVTLPPMRVFPARDVAAAFRQMAHGHHVGKILIRLKEKRPHSHSAGAFFCGWGLGNHRRAGWSRIAVGQMATESGG